MKNKDIHLDEGKIIKWIDVHLPTISFETLSSLTLDVSLHFMPIEKFWKMIEKHCVAECCGIYAYDFSRIQILNALKSMNTEMLLKVLLEIKNYVNLSDKKIISAMLLNNLLDKQVFLNLLE